MMKKKILVIEAEDGIIKSNLKGFHRSNIALWAMNANLREEWIVDDDFELTDESIAKYANEFLDKHRFCILDTVCAYLQ